MTEYRLSENDLRSVIEKCESKRTKSEVYCYSQEELNDYLNLFYELLKDSDTTVTEVVSYKQNRISFKNGSSIQLIKET